MSYWTVTATNAQGNVCYTRTHIYKQDAINDYNSTKRLFIDCTVEMEEEEE